MVCYEKSDITSSLSFPFLLIRDKYKLQQAIFILSIPDSEPSDPKSGLAGSSMAAIQVKIVIYTCFIILIIREVSE